MSQRTWELINPSDKATFLAPDLEIAAVVTFCLGEGHYGAETKDDGVKLEVPIFLFGGSDEWSKRSLGKSVEVLFQSVKTERNAELIAAFDSFLYADASDREAHDELRRRMSPEEWAAHRSAFQEKRRSSLNNIGRRAQHFAEHFAVVPA